jgi:hypothetical protein
VRRRRSPAVTAPESLIRFVAVEWPGEDLQARLAAWKAARRQWHDAHGCGPWGDAIDMLVEERKTRERLRG